MAITGKVGAVYVSDVNAAPVAFTDQATTKDATLTRYQVTNAAYRYWPFDATIIVKKNGTVITTGFHLERAGGYIVFDTALASGDAVTVSGTALTLIQCGGFFSWSIDAKAKAQDATTFASGGWTENLVAVKNWAGKAEAYWGDDRFYKSLGEKIVVKLFIDSGASQRCLEGFAVISGDSVDNQVDSIVKESITFDGTGPLYPRL